MLRLTDEEINKRCNSKNVTKIAGNYIDGKINVKCSSCGNVWSKKPSNLQGCNKCARAKSGLNRKINEIEINAILFKCNIKKLEEYINSKSKIKLQCLICNYCWMTKITHITYNKSGCPKCNLPGKNEKYIFDILKQNNIYFSHNLNIKKINNHELYNYRVDFFIPEKRLIIEYNGRQHYEPVCFGNISLSCAKRNLQKQKIRDSYIKNFCNKNNIKLICIDGRKLKSDKLKKYIINNFT